MVLPFEKDLENESSFWFTPVQRFPENSAKGPSADDSQPGFGSSRRCDNKFASYPVDEVITCRLPFFEEQPMNVVISDCWAAFKKDGMNGLNSLCLTLHVGHLLEGSVQPVVCRLAKSVGFTK